MSIYADRDPRDIPAYSVAEVAHCLRLPPSTVRAWVRGQGYRTRRGEDRRFEPVVDLDDTGPPLALSFTNLIELNTLAVIRRVHGVQLPRVREGIEFMRRIFKTHRPLATEHLLTDGTDLFLEKTGLLMNASRGQVTLREFLIGRLRRVEWDGDHLPVRFYPLTRREDLLDAPQSVVMDPRVSFGRPVLKGTGVATEIVAERFEAGDSPEHLAEDYRLQLDRIYEALRFELGLRAA